MAKRFQKGGPGHPSRWTLPEQWLRTVENCYRKCQKPGAKTFIHFLSVRNFWRPLKHETEVVVLITRLSVSAYWKNFLVTSDCKLLIEVETIVITHWNPFHSKSRYLYEFYCYVIPLFFLTYIWWKLGNFLRFFSWVCELTNFFQHARRPSIKIS